jgi:hypothetical protein
MNQTILDQIDLMCFDLFIEDYPPTKYAEVPQELFQKYSGILPDFMLAVWQKHGFTHHANAFFWIVNPDDYIELLDFLLGKNHDLIVFSRDSFGHMKAIRKDGRKFEISAETGHSGSIGQSAIDYTFSALSFDEKNETYQEHLKAIAKLGIPSEEEIFGYVPALALGGEGTLEETKIVRMHEYLFMVAELAIEYNKQGREPFFLEHINDDTVE